MQLSTLERGFHLFLRSVTLLREKIADFQTYPFTVPAIRTRKEAQSRIFEYIEFFYNRKRVHSAIGYLTPVEYEQMYDQAA